MPESLAVLAIVVGIFVAIAYLFAPLKLFTIATEARKQRELLEKIERLLSGQPR